MLRSMTGFGAAARSAQDTNARVEIRSVNHRHLQVKTRLPQAFSQLEPQIEAAVRARLTRGSVVVSVDLDRGARGAARIDAAALASWRDAVARAADDAGLKAEIPLSTLLGLPGVIASTEHVEDVEATQALILSVLDAAIGEMEAMRAREGAALDADLRRNAQAIAAITAKIAERMPAAVIEHHAALRKRLADLLEGNTRGPRLPNEADLAREIALLADRMDVSEELTRLASHLQQLETLLGGDGPVGRPLDFLVQELFREANTIGSKCSDAAAAHLVVEMKTLLERLREQVQNVE